MSRCILKICSSRSRNLSISSWHLNLFNYRFNYNFFNSFRISIRSIRNQTRLCQIFGPNHSWRSPMRIIIFLNFCYCSSIRLYLTLSPIFLIAFQVIHSRIWQINRFQLLFTRIQNSFLLNYSIILTGIQNCRLFNNHIVIRWKHRCCRPWKTRKRQNQRSNQANQCQKAQA